MSFETVYWKSNQVIVLDQTQLPQKVIYHSYKTPEQVALSIEKMIVRGAPAIGVTAALGLALAAVLTKEVSLSVARSNWDKWVHRFSSTRPTAVNLFWALDRMKKCSQKSVPSIQVWTDQLLQEALTIHKEDIDACKKMGKFGSELIPDSARILTHCNAGALATAGWGTALGVIRSAVADGKKVSVWIDETRPFLQGARLTAWEMLQENIPATLITDNMAGHFLYQKEVDLVIVGADRIASNGDVANKIGTYSLSVLAHENGIPMYVAAPLSTIDLSCPSGKQIPIEERDPNEVLCVMNQKIAPEGCKARHPAFDISPARYISAIITEAGIARPPYSETLVQLFHT